MKKFLSSLLILVFILVPAGILLGCTNTAQNTNTAKISWTGQSVSKYRYYISKSTGSAKIIMNTANQFNNGTNAYQPIIKINGVPLNVDYISAPHKTQDSPLITDKTQKQESPSVPDTNLKPKPVPSVPDTNQKPEPAPSVPASNQTSEPEAQPAPNTEAVGQPASNASSMQSEMLGYINAERAQANLAPLILDDTLCQGAYLKSKDMAVNNYFSHTSPTYGSPFDMMKSLGITYRTAGENIAKNSSVKGAHDAFMNSSGHRANILNSGFNKIGLGFYQEGNYLYVTQWFTN